MTLKTLFGPLSILVLALVVAPAAAAPLDKSANAKIDEAINVHYLSTNFEKAEGLLKGTLKACGDRCSPSVKARAWMYIGIVRGAGNQDMDGAAAAFAEALALDPNHPLDNDLATDELREIYAASGGGGESTGTTEDVPLLEEAGGATAAPAGTMTCSPDVAEVETRRPIPVSCATDQPATRATLYFKEFGGGSWTQVNMGKSGDGWLAQIPCSATGIQGTLAWYVKATGGKGETLDAFGSESAPIQVAIVESSALPPPAHPGKEAPERCMDLADCPEEMRGTPACPGTTKGGKAGGSGGWGDSCRSSSDCQSELTCMEGTCETPPSCEVDEDCSGGTCVDFLCRYDDGGDGDWEDEGGGGSGKSPKNFVGLHVGFDLAQISGDAVCNRASGSKFACYVGDQLYDAPAFRWVGSIFDPANPAMQGTVQSQYHNPMSPAYDPAQSGAIGSSLAPSTIRIMASYERFMTDEIAVEARLGAALGGAPDSGFADLLHAEARGKYWFSGMGPGLRLFGLLGAGIGQVDAKKTLQIQEFEEDNSPTYQTYCAPGAGSCLLPVTAYKKLGTTFVAAGLGGFLNFGGHGPSLEIVAKVMFPESGFVIQPTGGWIVGF